LAALLAALSVELSVEPKSNRVKELNFEPSPEPVYQQPKKPARV